MSADARMSELDRLRYASFKLGIGWRIGNPQSTDFHAAALEHAKQARLQAPFASQLVKELRELADKIDAEDIAERKRIGEARAPQRAAAFEEHIRKEAERMRHDYAECARCGHHRISHHPESTLLDPCDPEDESCDCTGFVERASVKHTETCSWTHAGGGQPSECECGALQERDAAIDIGEDLAQRTLAEDTTACRECGSTIGFCHPSCSTQGRD